VEVLKVRSAVQLSHVNSGFTVTFSTFISYFYYVTPII